MKKALSIFLLIAISLLSLVSCGKQPQETPDPTPDKDPDPITLRAPVITIDDEGNAAWTKEEGTASFVIVVDDGAEQTQDTTGFKLENGQVIKVKAIGDGETYLDSSFSEPKTYIEPDHFSNYY